MKWKRAVEAALTLAGILLVIAPNFGLLPWKYGVFAGIACFLAVAAVEQIFD
jgi:hypothetical protein